MPRRVLQPDAIMQRHPRIAGRQRAGPRQQRQRRLNRVQLYLA